MGSSATPLQILTHLNTTYGTITPEDLLENRAQLRKPWSPPSEIEIFFQHLEDCKSFSVSGDDEISDLNIVSAGVATLKQTGLFGLAMREWN